MRAGRGFGAENAGLTIEDVSCGGGGETKEARWLRPRGESNGDEDVDVEATAAATRTSGDPGRDAADKDGVGDELLSLRMDEVIDILSWLPIHACGIGEELE